MFLHNLNNSQKEAFLVLASQFIRADHTVTDEEAELVELMRREADIEFPKNALDIDKLSVLDVFKSMQSKVAIILELLYLGYIDHEFSPEENYFIIEVATTLGISEDKLATYAHWVLGNIAWKQEASRFWVSPR